MEVYRGPRSPPPVCPLAHQESSCIVASPPAGRPVPKQRARSKVSIGTEESSNDAFSGYGFFEPCYTGRFEHPVPFDQGARGAGPWCQGTWNRRRQEEAAATRPRWTQWRISSLRSTGNHHVAIGNKKRCVWRAYSGSFKDRPRSRMR